MNGWVSHCALPVVQLAHGFAYHLLGHTGTFSALAGDAKGFANLFVAAATFVDGLADLTVGYALAQANIHAD
jgi:hypothetical protein